MEEEIPEGKGGRVLAVSLQGALGQLSPRPNAASQPTHPSPKHAQSSTEGAESSSPSQSAQCTDNEGTAAGGGRLADSPVRVAHGLLVSEQWLKRLSLEQSNNNHPSIHALPRLPSLYHPLMPAHNPAH